MLRALMRESPPPRWPPPATIWPAATPLRSLPSPFPGGLPRATYSDARTGASQHRPVGQNGVLWDPSDEDSCEGATVVARDRALAAAARRQAVPTHGSGAHVATADGDSRLGGRVSVNCSQRLRSLNTFSRFNGYQRL